MTWLILTILLTVIGTAALCVGIFATDGYARGWGFGIFGVAVVVWLVFTVGLSVHGVGQRKVGIVYNFAGVITGKRDPGIVWTAPWQHIKTANVGIQREDFVLDEGNSAVSRDQQPVYANLSLNYQVQPSNIIRLYKSVGPGWKETLLDSRVLQDFKEVTSDFSAAEITTKRPELRIRTVQRLQQELQPYDVKVTGFFVKNLGYSHSYSESINAKNQQVQKSLQAQAKVAQAQAEAKQIVATAEGNAKANRLQSTSLTPQVLMNRAINTLNKNVAVIYCQQGTLCIPNSSLAPFQSALKTK